MSTKTSSKAGAVFDSDVAEDLQDPSARAFFEKEYAKTVAVGELLRLLEMARARQNLTKRELADKMDRKASAVSRLLSGEGANPTLGTIADLAFALNLEIEVVVRDRPPRSRRPQTPLRIKAAA